MSCSARPMMAATISSDSSGLLPRLLREVRMSTPTVLADTLALAAEEGLRVALLPMWYDVDDVASLERLRAELMNAGDGVAPWTRAFLARNF